MKKEISSPSSPSSLLSSPSPLLSSTSSSLPSSPTPAPPYRLFKLIYFLLFASLGAFQPYIPLYFESLEFSKSKVGILSMIPNMASFFIAPLWGYTADYLNAHSEVMLIGIITSTVTTVMVLFTKSFSIIFVIVIIASSFRAPISCLIDALVIGSLPNKEDYGSMRLFGAISYGLFSFISGLIVQDFKIVIFIHSILMFATGFVVLSIDRKYEPKTTSNNEVENETAIWESIVEVFKRGMVQAFVLIVFLSGFGSGVIDSFLFIRMRELGSSGLVMGISRSITCAAEVPMFALGGYLEKRFGTFKVLAITQLALVFRFLYYSNLKNPVWIFPCEVLHGFTFAVMWQVSCSYANKVSSKNNQASLQALLEGIYWGVGSGLGALIGGFLYDAYGAVTLFEISAVLSFISMIISLIVSIVETKYNDQQGRDIYSQVTLMEEQGDDYSQQENGYEKVIPNGDIELVGVENPLASD
jgi:predicted MFS family arabinose efflux permease